MSSTDGSSSDPEATTPSTTQLWMAAVLGGVALLYFLQSSSQKDTSATSSRELELEEEETETQQKTAAAPSKNKKKKKKPKKKAAVPDAVPTPEEPVAAPAATAPVTDEEEENEEPSTAAKKKKKKKKKKAAPQPEPEPEAEPEPEPQAEPEPEPAKKKRQRKKKSKNGAATAAATNNTNSNNNNNVAETVYYEKPAVQEEEWQTVSKKTVKAVPEPASSSVVTNEPVVLNIGADPALIIGKQGSTIQGIEKSTGAKLEILKAHPMDHSNSNQVRISGDTAACIQQAVTAVATILEQDAAYKARQVQKELKFDSDQVKAIIGKKGAVIQDIQKQTHCKIDATVETGVVIIKGEQPGVDQALALCEKAVHGAVQQTMDLRTRGAVNVVFGKNFTQIRQLQDQSGGAKLDIDKNSTILKMSGEPEQVALAQQLVTQLLQANAGITFCIDKSKVGAIYGKAGSNIREIQDRTGAFVEVTDTLCSIMGPPEAVQKARKLVQMAMDGERELKPGELQRELDLGVGASAVIGRGGSRVVELEKKHSVEINIKSSTAMCKIFGLEKNVEAAVAEIQSIAQPLIDEAERMKVAAQMAEAGDTTWTAGPDEADGW